MRRKAFKAISNETMTNEKCIQAIPTVRLMREFVFVRMGTQKQTHVTCCVAVRLLFHQKRTTIVDEFRCKIRVHFNYKTVIYTIIF